MKTVIEKVYNRIKDVVLIEIYIVNDKEDAALLKDFMPYEEKEALKYANKIAKIIGQREYGKDCGFTMINEDKENDG